MSPRTGLAIVIAIVVVVLVYALMNYHDNRTASDRIGDAVHELPNGPGKAADQLGNRTPAQRAGDAIKNMGK